MNFFKHFTDSHEGSNITALINEFGLKGYAFYFILVEMCAKRYDPKNRDFERPEDEWKFVFHERILRQKLHVSSTNLARMLHFCATISTLSCTKVGDKWEIYLPKLLESLDRDSKSARYQRGKSRLDKEEDKEEEVDKESPRFSNRFHPLQLVDIFNKNTNGVIPKVDVKTFTPDKPRYKKAKLRCKEHPDPDYWLGVCKRIESTPFLCGKNDRGWTVTFDWLIKNPENHLKITEGNYDGMVSKPRVVLTEVNHALLWNDK